ncbi:MAG: CBS domain-containing protein [Desulfobacterales bacterium]|nr:CBS domain-containing protein [Desulfobacterales bacterium]
MDKTRNGLTVITTHLNADYDAIGSMLAAQKLYTDAIVVFPGFHEKSARHFFIDAMAYLFNMADAKSINDADIERLVVVDTKQPSRIGSLSRLLGRSRVEVHVFDHHPALKDDIKADYEVSRLTGANVTLLTEIIRERNLDILPDEATIMCLGIFEDTGSFTFPSTTPEDFSAAGFLVSKGANLTTIANLIAKEMDPDQIALLNDLIHAAVHHAINGVDVVISSVSCEAYVHDLAFLVQKILKIENLNAIIAIAQMKNKIYLAARSRVPEVDVGAIVTEMGGGGHSFAAAATIKDKTLVQTEQKLLEILRKKVKSKQRARDIMSSPPITADPEISCAQARNRLSRYNINALIVIKETDGGALVQGFITRPVIEKTLYHQLDDIPISEYMTTEFATVAPDADIFEIQEKIIENNQRVLPVMADNALLGVITRTDLLNILFQESHEKLLQPQDPLKETLHPRTKKIVGFMKERLPDRLYQLLVRIGQVAEEIGYNAYVVGGFVRDLFLYRHNEDLDIVIEGDGIAFAKEFARRSDARINAYAKFGTAVIIFPDGFKIDVASARMEYYKFPAALPTVEMSSIKLDLFRRDFTINTLAVFLNQSKFGKLIDFFGGQRDIKEKAIRILHNLSFVEDPTRVFRAIRFEQRFGFTIGKLTSGLIENAVRMDFFERLSGRRVFSELCQILKEDTPLPALSRLNDYHLLRVIDPTIQFDQAMIARFNAARKVISWFDLLYTEEAYMRWAVYFLVLLRHVDGETSTRICQRFELGPKYEKIFVKERIAAEACVGRLHRDLPASNSELYQMLADFQIELILYMMAITDHETIKKMISHYVTDLREVKLSVGGKDLKALGVAPSPVYGKILNAVHEAKLDKKIETREEELALLKEYAARY